MSTNSKIPVFIVDDDKEAIFSLQSYLELMPEVAVVGSATNYLKAIKQIKEMAPELVFLDIEMPGKTGFELLADLESNGSPRKFDVIFHTAYDKYALQALREAAFDYILKPARPDELREAVNRFIQKRKEEPKPTIKIAPPVVQQIVSLPTGKGLRFIPKNEIVYVECLKKCLDMRSLWHVTLLNGQNISLRPNTNSETIMNYLGDDSFVIINKGTIVNITYISSLEYKSFECILFPPFDKTPLKVSRQYMADLRNRFDVL